MAKHQSICVSVAAVSLLLDYIDHAGLALPSLRACLNELKTSPRMPITTWWKLLEELQRASPVEAVGLDIGSLTQAHHIGMLGHLAVYSSTVLQALQRVCRFQALLQYQAPSQIHVERNDLVVRWDPSWGCSPLLSDAVISAGLVALVRRHCSLDTSPCSVEFPQPRPVNIAPYEAFFRCPVYFSCEALAVRLPVQHMNMPVATRQPQLLELLEPQAEVMLQLIPEEGSFLQQLRQHISMSLLEGAPEFGDVASRMGMAERTLYRHLHERGLRYKSILNELRFKLAQDFMRDPKLSLPDIALLLGYAEQSVFSRAFREWSGESPANYRRTYFGPTCQQGETPNKN